MPRRDRREQSYRAQIRALEKQLAESDSEYRRLVSVNEIYQIRNGELSEELALLRLEVETLRRKLSWEG